MKILVYLLGLFFLSNCDRKDDDSNDYPECLNSQIQVMLQSPIQNPKATIKKFKYQNKIVFYINPNIPDGVNTVVDESCNIICSDGSIAGQTSNPCIDWNSAIYISTVWTDPR